MEKFFTQAFKDEGESHGETNKNSLRSDICFVIIKLYSATQRYIRVRRKPICIDINLIKKGDFIIICITYNIKLKMDVNNTV